MTKTITFNELRRIKDSLPDGSMHRIADELNVTVQTVRNYFGGNNYEFGKNCGLHIEPGPDGGIVVLDNTTIYDMAMKILEEETHSLPPLGETPPVPLFLNRTCTPVCFCVYW